MTGIDRVNAPLGTARHVRPEFVTDRTDRVGGTDHGDRGRHQQPCDGGRIGALLTALHRVDELGRLVEWEVDVDDARIERSMHRPPRLGEHRQHRPIVAQGLGIESVQTVRTSDCRKVLQQEAGNALAVVPIVDHEGDLGVVAVLPSFVTCPSDELAVLLDDECCSADEIDRRESLQFQL